MTELAISASSGTFACALQHSGIVTKRVGRPRGDDLATLVAALVADAGLAPDDVDGLIVDVGPGSYTGLRVAVTFARMLAAFRGARLRTCTSLELHALAAHRAFGVTLVRPALDARRGRIHHALIAIGERVDVREAPRASTVDELIALHREGIVLHEPALATVLAAMSPRTAMTDACAVDVADMFAPSLVLVDSHADRIEPLYLMGSYAE
jgi:tRNA threonylcarbamoyl adenosine modification protein YeaZ